MLNRSEISGARELFLLLTDDEVMSLARTVTKDQIHLSTTAEAVDAILAYTDSAAELLHRRKVKRETLFKYLYKEGISIAPTADKNSIIQKVLEHWGSVASQINFLVEDEGEDDHNTIPTSSTQGLEIESDTMQQILAKWQTGDSWHNDTLKSTEEDHEMAVQFSRWFYQMLNTCNPMYLTQNSSAEHFGPHHFYNDARLTMLTIDKGQHQVETVDNSVSVCRRLTDIANELVFNPNLNPSGIKGLSDPHGMKVIIVCGTVHRSLEVLGPFEQQFGLVRDPFSKHNWKIKFSRLALMASNLLGLPTLDQTRKMLST